MHKHRWCGHCRRLEGPYEQYAVAFTPIRWEEVLLCGVCWWRATTQKNPIEFLTQEGLEAAKKGIQVSFELVGKDTSEEVKHG